MLLTLATIGTRIQDLTLADISAMYLIRAFLALGVVILAIGVLVAYRIVERRSLRKYSQERARKVLGG